MTPSLISGDKNVVVSGLGVFRFAHEHALLRFVVRQDLAQLILVLDVSLGWAEPAFLTGAFFVERDQAEAVEFELVVAQELGGRAAGGRQRRCSGSPDLLFSGTFRRTGA